MTRIAVLAGAALAVGALAGCSGGSDGGRVTVTASYASTGSTPTSTSGAPGTGATSGNPSSGSSSGSPSTSASIPQPPSPSATGGGTGAWSLTRAAPGAPAQGQVASLRCGQDGSVTSDTVQVAAGGASLTLLGADGAGSSVTVGGTSEVDAAGGTFTGRDATVAVTFTWVC